MIDAYPLVWPPTWPREQNPQSSAFKTSLVNARNGLIRELELLGARNIVISTNAELTRSGEIAARQRRIDDTGVAAYFTLHGEQRCIPCDKWVKLEDNLHAIELAVNALRGLERWGAKQMVDAAFRGFAALPGGNDSVLATALGIHPTTPKPDIERAYRSWAKRNHPDIGGDADLFREVTSAYQEALRAAR